MVDTTAAFIDGLATRGFEPLMDGVTARIRLEVMDGRTTGEWLVDIKEGELSVEKGGGEADCVIRATHETFDDLAAGRTNAMAAYLRGRVAVEGDPRLLVRFQRLFPAPVGMPKAATGSRTTGKRRS